MKVVDAHHSLHHAREHSIIIRNSSIYPSSLFRSLSLSWAWKRDGQIAFLIYSEEGGRKAKLSNIDFCKLIEALERRTQEDNRKKNKKFLFLEHFGSLWVCGKLFSIGLEGMCSFFLSYRFFFFGFTVVFLGLTRGSLWNHRLVCSSEILYTIWKLYTIDNIRLIMIS